MDILNKLIELDKNLLFCMNGTHTPFGDNFFWLVTAIPTWIPFYAVILFVVAKKHRPGWWYSFLAFGVLVLLCDQISNSLLKDVIQRWRPSRDPSLTGMVNLVVGYKGGKFGFVSSHAANSFGLAMFATLLFRHRGFGIAIFMWAAMNSYSRIYMGVHFPGDVLGGAILGALIACGLYWAYARTFPRFANGKNPTSQPGLLGDKVFPNSDMNLLVFSLCFLVTILLIAAKVFMKMQS